MALACSIGPLCCLATETTVHKCTAWAVEAGRCSRHGLQGHLQQSNCPSQFGEHIISCSALWLIAGYLNIFLVVRVPFALPYVPVSFQTKFLRCSFTWSSSNCLLFYVLASTRAHPLSCNIKTFSRLCKQRTAGCYLFCTVQVDGPRYCAEVRLGCFFFLIKGHIAQAWKPCS